MSFTKLFLPLVLAFGLSACVFEDRSTEQVSERGALADFSKYVQPVLRVGCASLDCHGTEGRPLRLYARNGLRMGASLRGQDETSAEMQANMTAIDGLDPQATQVENHLLLLKPLAVDAGGISHIGGDLWPDQSDGVYRCLHAWLRSGVSDEAGRQVCTEVLP